jgi:SAM-dependent methyltransferase
MAEWYKEWFNTPEYMDVYRHRDDEDALKLADLIFKIIELKPESRVLDMACGFGRHSIIFAQRGMEVTAVDLSENLLSIANTSAEKLNLNITFVNADLRHFYIEKKFDLALNLFTSFGYFQTDEENFKVFKQAHLHLKENGIFVFDFFNSKFLENNLPENSCENLNGFKLIQERRIINKRIEKKIVIRNDGLEKEYMESVKLYSYGELIEMITKVGFKIIHTFGGFAGNNFNIDTSSRLIIFAKR